MINPKPWLSVKSILRSYDHKVLKMLPNWRCRKGPGSEWYDLNCDGRWGEIHMKDVAAWCEETFGSGIITKQSRWYWYGGNSGLRIRTPEDLAWFMLRWTS